MDTYPWTGQEGLGVGGGGAAEGDQPPLLFASLTQSLSQDSKVWRVLTMTDVGSVTQGLGFHITKCYLSVVHSMLRDFGSCFGMYCLCNVPAGSTKWHTHQLAWGAGTCVDIV